jgi:Protein of unknown function, DUF488
MPSTVWTIGHSTRPLNTFLALLEHYRIEAVADVRRFPGSRRQPLYAQVPLGSALTEDGITYQWIVALGGRRRPRPDSPNTAGATSSFAVMPTTWPAGSSNKACTNCSRLLADFGRP